MLRASERKRDRETERERQADRERQRQRDRERETEREDMVSTDTCSHRKVTVPQVPQVLRF